jgi:hypothetical protein
VGKKTTKLKAEVRRQKPKRPVLEHETGLFSWENSWRFEWRVASGGIPDTLLATRHPSFYNRFVLKLDGPVD